MRAGGVIKLAAILTFDVADIGEKLSFNIGEKVGQGGKGVGFKAKRESPNIVRKIVKNDKIIFENRNANDRNVHKSQFINSKLAEALVTEVAKGRLPCRPS